VQEPVPGIAPPVRVTVGPPALAVITPPQVVVAFGVAAITMPMGRVSTSGAVRLASAVPALPRVMVSVATSPARMVAGAKDLPSVGGMGVPGVVPQTDMATELESSVTAPFRARTLPETLAPLFRVMLVSAMIFPMNDVDVPRVAELPTCQKTLHGWPPLVSSTDEPAAVVRVLPVRNTQTALGSPPASSVSVPVNWAEDEKQ
jgi:hypothetical protein